jgi:hypothetical protein
MGREAEDVQVFAGDLYRSGERAPPVPNLVVVMQVAPEDAVVAVHGFPSR